MTDLLRITAEIGPPASETTPRDAMTYARCPPGIIVELAEPITKRVEAR